MNQVPEAGRRPVSRWLFTVAALILAMILLGGLTRLTNSGLSMVEWRVIMGTVPPLNEAQWHEVFEKYKRFPEYREHNQGMALEDFKFIFLMEYAHRLLGRLIGLAFAIPFCYFLWRKWLRGPMIGKCLILFALGGLQGLIGWYMVKSGLVDVPRVSHYRLVLHLSAAVLVYTLCLWYAFGLRFADSGNGLARPRVWRRAVLAVWIGIGLQILSGGLVAGLKAGFGFNTFPKMNDSWIPAAVLSFRPWYRDLMDNPVTVQFVHRWLALAVAAMVLVFCHRLYWRNVEPRLRKTALLLAGAVLLQLGLGIATLLMRVPVSLASFHQAGAMLVWTLTVFAAHQLFQGEPRLSTAGPEPG